MSKKLTLVYFLIACLVVVLAAAAIGCGEATEETTTSIAPETTAATGGETTTSVTSSESTTTSASSATPIRVAIDTGGVRTDASWSQSIYNAFVSLQEKYPDVEFTFSDNVPYNDLPALVSQQAQDGIDLIYSDSTLFAAVQATAGDFPDTWFAIQELTQDDIDVMPANVTTYFYSYAEALYMAGIAAGLETKSNVIAAVLGNTGYPDLNSAAYAFFEGAQSVNPNVKFVVGVTGDWVDIQKGYDQAMACIDAGADILMHFSDNGGKGVIKAAQEKGARVVGEALDQSYLAPDTVITSYLVPHEFLAEKALIDFMEGKISKKVSEFTVKDGLPPLVTPLANVSDDTRAKVEAAQKSIMDGTLTITPHTESEALDEFVLGAKE